MTDRIRPMPAVAALTMRELRRFWRQPTRLVGSLGTPLLLWLFGASGFAESFRREGASTSFGEYLVPGVITMVVLFSTILASISLIQDRHDGFLQSVLVSPVPRWVVVAAKVLGGGIVCMVQAGLLIVGLGVFGQIPDVTGVLLALVAASLISIALIGIGLAAAWYIDSTAGFHGVMNLLFLPMWLLSGAIFPQDGAAPWLGALMSVNPLTWSTHTLGQALGVHEPGAAWHWVGTVAFALFGVVLATVVIMQPKRSD